LYSPLFECGKFILNATNANSTSFPVVIMLHSKSKNAVIVDDNIIVNGQCMTKRDELPLLGKDVWGVGHITLIKEFYSALTDGRKFCLDFEEAQKVIKLLLSLYESEGKEIIIER
jgi:hypothetical protein